MSPGGPEYDAYLKGEEEIPESVKADLAIINPEVIGKISGRVVFNEQSGRQMLDRELRDLLLRGYRVLESREGSCALVEDSDGGRFQIWIAQPR